MTIYGRIRKLREGQGMTQEELAKKIGYKSRSTINKIESGLRDINQSQIILFAKALNVTPAYLMGWEENKDEFQIDLSVAVIKYLIKTPDAIPSWFSFGTLMDDMYYYSYPNEKTQLYCSNLLQKLKSKKELSEIELYELATISFKEIKVSNDLDNMVIVTDFDDQSFNIEYSELDIKTISFDLKNSPFFKYYKENTNSNTVFKSPLASLSAQKEFQESNDIQTIAAHHDGEEWTEEELEEIEAFKEFVKSKRKK